MLQNNFELALVLSHFLFLRNSKQYFIQSLSREIHYWKSINTAEISEVIELIELWRSLNSMPKLENTNAHHGISATAADE